MQAYFGGNSSAMITSRMAKYTELYSCLPFNGGPLTCLAPQEREHVLQELRRLEGAVSKLTVVGQGDTKAGAEETNGFGDEEPPPREQEGSKEDEQYVVQDDAIIALEVHLLHAFADLIGVQSPGIEAQQRTLQFHHMKRRQRELVCSRLLLVSCLIRLWIGGIKDSRVLAALQLLKLLCI